MAGEGTDEMPRGALRSMLDEACRLRSPLTIAAILVVFLYGGTLAWLWLSDGKLAGEPVVRLVLAPEAEPTSDAGELLRPGAPDERRVAPGAPEAHVATLPEPPTAEAPTPDEQALLDAARRVTGGEDGPADGVTILGAGATPENDGSIAAGGPSAGALPPVPDRALVAQGRQGPLPIISSDGREAWKIYARPLPKGLAARPRIALVVSGMGISDNATAHAIEMLPPEVTLSFAPYGADLQSWIGKARGAGHEVLLELPMEPFGYPQNDPGPYTLLTSLQPTENISRLEWLLSRFAGYAGVMNYQGARFTSSPTALSPILAALKARGLMYVDNGASQRSLAPKLAGELGLPISAGTRFIDPIQNPEVIGQSLAALEEAAKQSGLAVGVASAFPITVDEVARWAETLKERGFVLVPVTATVGGTR